MSSRALASSLAALLLAAVMPTPAEAFSHRAFDKILRKHVRGGKVDYAGIKAKADKPLTAYLKRVASASVGGMSKKAKLAFYINAYNAVVIKAVIDRWPKIVSVLKVPGFFKSKRYRIGGRSLTLDQLENKVIRPTFNEARIHVALVCGARSCPPLMSRAFSAGRLERDLARLTKRFVNSWRGVVVKGSAVSVSRLFKWYKQDFVAAAGSVKKFILKYRKKDADKIKAAAKLKHLWYDWSLNKK